MAFLRETYASSTSPRVVKSRKKVPADDASPAVGDRGIVSGDMRGNRADKFPSRTDLVPAAAAPVDARSEARRTSNGDRDQDGSSSGISCLVVGFCAPRLPT